MMKFLFIMKLFAKNIFFLYFIDIFIYELMAGHFYSISQEVRIAYLRYIPCCLVAFKFSKGKGLAPLRSLLFL